MWQPSNCNLDVSMGTWENISIALIYFLKTLILIQLVAFSFFGSHIYIYIYLYIYIYTTQNTLKEVVTYST